MQRYNFQFTGQRFFRIEHGRLAGQVRDVAYQATTTDFWGALEAVGGRSTYLLGGAFNCGKGQPGQVAPVSHGCPSALVGGVRILNTRKRVGPMTTDGLPPAQDVVEDVLAAARSGSDECVAIVEDTSEVEVRFANNTTTTNGSRRDRRVTVVVMRPVEGGTAVGVARRGGDVDVAELARAAAQDAAGSPPADDLSPLVSPDQVASIPAAGARFGGPPGQTDLSVLSGVLDGLAGAFTRARSGDYVVAGFAEHRRTTEYLGTSTGLRLAHCQPEGALQLVARSADGASSTWAGAGTADFSDVSIGMMEERLRSRLAWSATRFERPAGRYEVILPPEAVSDLMVNLAFEAGGRDAEDGRTVFARHGGGTRVGDRLSPLAFDLRSDPAEPGLECSPFLTAASSSADTSVFDNGLPLLPDGLDRRRASQAAPLPPGRRRPVGCGPGRLHRQFRARAARCHRLGRGAGGPDRARPAAHLSLVHPGGGPGHAAVDRAHPRRRLRGRGRPGGRGGQQLPVQREPGRSPGPGHRGGGQRAGIRPGARRVPQPDPNAAAAHPRLQHEFGQPGQLTGGRSGGRTALQLDRGGVGLPRGRRSTGAGRCCPDGRARGGC